MSSGLTLSELCDKIAQLNCERDERKRQLDNLDVEIEMMETELSDRKAEIR